MKAIVLFIIATLIASNDGAGQIAEVIRQRIKRIMLLTMETDSHYHVICRAKETH